MVMLQVGVLTVMDCGLNDTFPDGVHLMGLEVKTGKHTEAVSQSAESVILGTEPSGTLSVSKSSRTPRAEVRTLMFPLMEYIGRTLLFAGEKSWRIGSVGMSRERRVTESL